MSKLAPEVVAWEAAVLRPALQEVCDSPGINREFYPWLHPEACCDSAEGVDELIQSLVKATRKVGGMSLSISYNPPRPGLPAIGGTYVMTALYRQVGDAWCASPGVCFWMKFNNKLHAFDHRYDNAIANHPVGEITKYHVQNHILGSFDFFKLHALSDQPFPGYR